MPSAESLFKYNNEYQSFFKSVGKLFHLSDVEDISSKSCSLGLQILLTDQTSNCKRTRRFLIPNT